MSSDQDLSSEAMYADQRNRALGNASLVALVPTRKLAINDRAMKQG